MFFVSVELPRQLQPDEIHLLVTLSEMAGNAIRRADLHQQTERQLQHLASLRAVDMAINTILDLRVTLGILIDHIVSQLKVDAVNILLINSKTQTLYHAASSGFHSDQVKSIRLYIGDSLAGQAIRTRTTIHIPNLHDSNVAQRASFTDRGRVRNLLWSAPDRQGTDQGRPRNLPSQPGGTGPGVAKFPGDPGGAGSHRHR